MQNTLCLESKLIAEDLYNLLQSLDRSNWREDLEATLRDRLSRIVARLRALLAIPDWATGDRRLARLQQRLRELAHLLEEMLPDMSVASSPIGLDWQGFRKRAGPAYEALAASLRRQAIHVPSLRPTNYVRNVFHVTSGLGALLLIQHVLTPSSMVWVTLACALSAWTMESTRRYSPAVNRFLMWIFGRVAHPHEQHRVNSSTWYVTALLGLALFATPLMCSIAVVVLAVADPAAAVIGRRFGRTRLRAGRSLEGSLTFVAAGGLAAWAALLIYYPALAIGTAAALAFAGAVAGAVAELLSQRVDDNFTIPVAVASGASLVSLALGM